MKNLFKSSCFYTFVIIISLAVLIAASFNRASQRQQQIEDLSRLTDTHNYPTDADSFKPAQRRSHKLALPDDLGSEPFKLSPSVYNGVLTTVVYSNTADMVKALNEGQADFAIMDYSQLVKYQHMGAQLEGILPCYSTEVRYGLLRNISALGTCNSVAYVVGTPSEYYSVFLGQEAEATILNPSFKRIPVNSADEAIRMVKRGEIDGALFDLNEQTPVGLKIAAKFKAKTFSYMLTVNCRLNSLASSSSSLYSSSDSDSTTFEILDTIFQLEKKLTDSEQQGLLISSMGRLNPERANIWKRSVERSRIRYVGSEALQTAKGYKTTEYDRHIAYLRSLIGMSSEYRALSRSILTDWKLAGTYEFPYQEDVGSPQEGYSTTALSKLMYKLEEEYSRKNAKKWTDDEPDEPESSNFPSPYKSHNDLPGADRSYSPLKPTGASSPADSGEKAANRSKEPSSKLLDRPTEEKATSTAEEVVPESANPESKTIKNITRQPHRSKSSREPISDQELFKKEIEDGLIPPPPKVPPVPKIPDELLQ